jgi:hypothetical protein
MRPGTPDRRSLVLCGALLLAPWPGVRALAGAAAPRAQDESADLNSLRNAAIEAYNAQDYPTAGSNAARYLDRAREQKRAGREVAAILFVLGHSRYEIQHARGGRYEGDYRAEVIAPLEDSLRILQDDPTFKSMLLGNAYYDLWTMTGRTDGEVEGQAHWYLLKSILARENDVRDRPRGSSEYDLFARHLLAYLDRCLDLAQSSATADLYTQSIRTAAPWGFATAYDARFWQIYDLTYFDEGNMQAAALWQKGLDAMRDSKADVDAVLATFSHAAELTRHKKDRAEIYRQMADFVSTLDEPERRAQMAEFARRAFSLDSGSAEIRRLLGSALHLLSYSAYATGKFEEALAQAQEATGFEWDGMEIAIFDLSRAAAELGHETEALSHGEKAYRIAKSKITGAALQPFAQNYVNILRQFGQDALASRVQREEAALGVR